MDEKTPLPARWLRQAAATVWVTAKQVFDGGFVSIIASNLVRIVQLVVFILLWKALAAAGNDLGGMSEPALLTYTLLSFALRQQLDIITPATSSLWEGSVITRYARPMPVYASYIAETIGRWWLPYWAFFSLPVLLLAPLLGVSPLPATPLAGLLFVPSLFLGVVVGFGVDILFSAFAMQLKNSVWMATRIREAAYNLLSGALIPFALLPRPVAAVLGLLPFGSVASAPLTIYTGGAGAGRLLALQAFWAVAIWVLGHLAYKKSEERMVSYGG